MKKRILIMIMILLLTTGCTCEYNLIIDGNTYKEEIILIGETQEEISEFQNNWKIPIDKDEYNKIAGFDGQYDTDGNVYKYNLSGNKLDFNYNFNRSQFANSTAVSNCYDKLTVSNYNNTTIISTSSKNNCFNKYLELTNIKVKIKVDREVISNNADNISGNTYIWNITKENASDKSINLVLSNGANEEDKPSSSSSNTNIKKNDYTLYIFLIILVIIVYLGYKWFMKFKDKNNNID